MEQLHVMTAEQMLKMLREGPTHQELAVIVKFLKDNHIEASVVEGGVMHKLLEELPAFDDEVDGLTQQ